jgi:hypothetical protein
MDKVRAEGWGKTLFRLTGQFAGEVVGPAGAVGNSKCSAAGNPHV